MKRLVPSRRRRCDRKPPRRVNLVGVGLALLISASNVLGQTPLTLQEAQRRAIDRSRMLAAQESAVTASREMAVAAGQLPDPVATLGINNLPIDTSDRFSLTRDFMTMRSVGVMQEFTRAEKREARAARFEREAEKSLAEKDAEPRRDSARHRAGVARPVLRRSDASGDIRAEPPGAARNRSRGERVSRRTRQSCRRPGRAQCAGASR